MSGQVFKHFFLNYMKMRNRIMVSCIILSWRLRPFKLGPNSIKFIQPWKIYKSFLDAEIVETNFKCLK